MVIALLELFVLFCNIVRALYGKDVNHLKLRQFVADYLQAEITFYRQFIATPPGPDNYIRRIREPGSWADDIELQIMSEKYDCSIEVYSDSTTPIKIFNENPTAIDMRVRLHYIGSCHYDAIWDSRRKNCPLEGHAFGIVEKDSLESAKGSYKYNKSNNYNSNIKEPQSPNAASRSYFEKFMTKSLVQATSNSLSTLEKDFDNLTKGVIKDYDNQQTDDQILKSVLAESVNDAYNPTTMKQKQSQNTNKSSLETVMHLVSMGFRVDECQFAIKQLPNTATLSQIVDKIQHNRETQLYLF